MELMWKEVSLGLAIVVVVLALAAGCLTGQMSHSVKYRKECTAKGGTYFYANGNTLCLAPGMIIPYEGTNGTEPR